MVNHYIFMDYKHRQAKKELEALAKTSGELVVYDDAGTLIGGELFLGHLSYANARAEATKLSQFYIELAQEVTADNKQERYDALHSIIG